jgi:hypothetical protein
MTTPEPKRFDMNALLRAVTGRGQTTETEPGNDETSDAETSSIDEPEPELSMTNLIRRDAGRRYLQPDEQSSKTTKPRANQVFNDIIRADAHSGRQFSFGLPISTSSDDQTEDG